jgi:hypothetical protein
MLWVLAFGACAMDGGGSSEGVSQQKSGTRAESKNAEMEAGKPSPEARLLGFLNLADKGDHR